MKTVLLGDVAEIVDSLHQTPKYAETGFPMVRVTDIKSGYLDTSNCFRVDHEVYKQFSKKHKPKQGDIVFSRVGTEGIPSYVRFDEDFCLGQNTVFILPKVNSRYIYYWLVSPEGKRQIKFKTTGSTQKTISLKSIKELKVDLPGESNQINAVKILESIDEKIELNRQMNETLEKIGQALFKYYFIDNPEAKSWETVTLKKISDYISRGISPKYDERGETLVVNQRCIRAKRLSLINARRQSKTFGSEKLLIDGDVLINSTGVGTLGRVAQVDEVPENTTFDSHVTVVRPTINKYFFGEMMRYLEPVFEDMGSGTTGQTELSRTAVEELGVKLPPTSKINNFGDEVKPLRVHMHNNDQEIQTLIKLRDSLLPRLISGKIKV